MSAPTSHFAPVARWLHWLMAVMIIAMLFIGRAWRHRCPSAMSGC